MTPTIVQTVFGGEGFITGGSPLYSGTFSNPPAAGNAIVIAFAGYDINTNTLTFTAPSTPNDAFTSIVTKGTNFPDSYGGTAYVQSQMWLSNFIVGGANSQTININGSEPHFCGVGFCAYEISGLSVSPIDATASGIGLSFPPGPFSLNPVSAATLAIAMLNPVTSDISFNIASGTGWTLDTATHTSALLDIDGEQWLCFGAEHQALSSASSVACALSQPLDGQGWAGTACTLKGVVPPGGTNSGYLSPHLQMRGVRH